MRLVPAACYEIVSKSLELKLRKQKQSTFFPGLLVNEPCSFINAPEILSPIEAWRL